MSITYLMNSNLTKSNASEHFSALFHNYVVTYKASENEVCCLDRRNEFGLYDFFQLNLKMFLTKSPATIYS